MVANGLQHDQRYRHRCRRLDFAGRSLDEIGAGVHGKHAGLAYLIERTQFAGFEDDFQVGAAAGIPDRGNLIENIAVIATQECAP